MSLFTKALTAALLIAMRHSSRELIINYLDYGRFLLPVIDEIVIRYIFMWSKAFVS